MERKVYSYKYDRGNGARAIARERIGQPPSRRVEVLAKHRKPKHKKRNTDE
jgi:hypothetical protein